VVSPGCAHCYAEVWDRRFRLEKEGTFFEPWTRANAEQNVRSFTDRLGQPFRWRRPRRVFVNSMSDLFHEQVSDEFLDRVFAVMALTPQHIYQILTKRPERMREYLDGQDEGGVHVIDRVGYEAVIHFGRREGWDAFDAWPLRNVWLGVSAEDQVRADARIPVLLATPAAGRFVSAEPLLGPIALWDQDPELIAVNWLRGSTDTDPDIPALDWVIVGGESGPGARPCDVGWVRSIVRQCKAVGVPVFVKQLGAHVIDRAGLVHRGDRMRLQSRKGSDPCEWPADLRVREFPEW
jgi:protein gp37